MRVRVVVVLLALGIVVASAGPVIAVAVDKLVCNGCVGTHDLDKGSVTSGKIRNGGVKTADLDKAAVSRKKIEKGAVSLGKLKTGVLMAARVKRSDGALIAGTEGVSSKRASQGLYEVTMPIDITTCVVTATHTPPVTSYPETPLTVAAFPGIPSSNVITVGVWNDLISYYYDADFSLTVVCP